MCGIGLNRIVAIEKNSMIRPILACLDPYKTAEQFAAAGWNIDFLILRILKLGILP